ncbi:MAG: PH domain-containing protein [Muribaculum sp.]|nr:PH domain-containing protein [Muribaculum sp.]
MQGSDLELMVGRDETILWRGKPQKKCFMLECVFNPMLPFALIWAFFDLGVIGMISLSGDGMGGMAAFLLLFFALHLMPVWIYLGGVFLSVRKYKHTEYIVTDRGIYVSGGAFAYTYEMKPFTDLSHINIHRGIFDQWLGVGDVVSVCAHTTSGSGSGHGSHGISICDIEDYQKVFTMIRDLQTDIYSDTMYPNDLRPRENHGYQTDYVNKDRWQ